MSISTSIIPNRIDDGQNIAQKTGSALSSFIAMLFAVKLRDSLDAATSGDKSDAAWSWGL
ncbi:MAG: hypothetical protein JWQ21_3715 [Herminiimonas sp.]|nr:hypothetical protein [Herminiimonas sp.]